MKKLGTGIKLLVCLLFAAVILYSNGGKALAAEFDPAAYSMKIGDKKIADGAVYDLGSPSVGIQIIDKEDKPLDTDQIDIAWTTSDSNVVSFEGDAEKSGMAGVTLTREAPGDSIITATLTERETGKVATYSCKIKIDFEIDSAALEKDGVLVDGILVLEKDDIQAVPLQYTDKTAIPDSVYTDAFLWNAVNDQVASVGIAADAGKVTAVGGGFTGKV